MIFQQPATGCLFNSKRPQRYCFRSFHHSTTVHCSPPAKVALRLTKPVFAGIASYRIGRYPKTSPAHSPLKLLHEAHHVEDELEPLYSVIASELGPQHALGTHLALRTALRRVLRFHEPAAHQLERVDAREGKVTEREAISGPFRL